MRSLPVKFLMLQEFVSQMPYLLYNAQAGGGVFVLQAATSDCASGSPCELDNEIDIYDGVCFLNNSAANVTLAHYSCIHPIATN